jgi:hypothetical protein
MKHPLLVDQFGKINHLTAVTETCFQFEEILFRELCGREKAVGDEHSVEEDERFDTLCSNKTRRH